MTATRTTYNGTEAIRWERVGLIWRPAKVDHDITAGAVHNSPKIDPDALCVRCGEQPRHRHNAIYCAPCRDAVAAEVNRASYLRGKKPCPGGCGELVDRRTSLCRPCRKKRRDMTPTKKQDAA
jgi:hypothetical protein